MKRSVRDFIIFVIVLFILGFASVATARGVRKVWVTRDQKIAAVKKYFRVPIPRRFIFPNNN